MNLSVDSIRLEGNLLNLTNGQAKAGDVVPIVATLMDHKGLLPGALVAAAIANEGGTDLTLLLDDGNHNDGAAGDGIYGFPYSLPTMVDRTPCALWHFPGPGGTRQNLAREWNGGFWVDGPQDDGKYNGDSDNDNMPDDWERRCDLIVGKDDSKGDNDIDRLAQYSRSWNWVLLPARLTRIAAVNWMAAKSEANATRFGPLMTRPPRS